MVTGCTVAVAATLAGCSVGTAVIVTAGTAAVAATVAGVTIVGVEVWIVTEGTEPVATTGFTKTALLIHLLISWVMPMPRLVAPICPS